MVAGFNKWCLVSVLPLFLLFDTDFEKSNNPITSTKETLSRHPLHLSVADIAHNGQDKTLEISCKLFTDDFENILEKNYKTNVDLLNPPDRPAVQKLVNDYIQKHLLIKLDGKAVSFNCIGFERDHEATFSYFEVGNITAFKKVEIVNTMMYDLFDDQANIMHVTLAGNRKSTKLNYPAKEASLSF